MRAPLFAAVVLFAFFAALLHANGTLLPLLADLRVALEGPR